jgi:FixJ family two-component response regulator
MEDIGVNPTPVIAIVDDHASVRDALQNLVRSFGFEAHQFGSAETYLQFSASTPVDCLISDLAMPDVDGLALLAKVKARGDTAAVIVMTALIGPEIRTQALAAGAVAALQKPFDDELLLDSITGALNAR